MELTEHAGFLLALGLTGYLRNMMTWHMFSYLTPKHDYTTIALLIGVSALLISPSIHAERGPEPVVLNTGGWVNWRGSDLPWHPKPQDGRSMSGLNRPVRIDAAQYQHRTPQSTHIR